MEETRSPLSPLSTIELHEIPSSTTASSSSSLSQRIKQYETERKERNKNRIDEDSEYDYEPRIRYPIIPRTPPPKTTLAAIIFTVLGLIFLSLGLSILYSNLLSHGKDRGLALIILGSISKRLPILLILCFYSFFFLFPFS